MASLEEYAVEFNLPVRSLRLRYGTKEGELASSVQMLFDRYREFVGVVSQYVSDEEWEETCSKGMVTSGLRDLLNCVDVAGYTAEDITELLFGVLEVQAKCFYQENIPDEYSEITTKLLGMTVKEIILKCDSFGYPIEKYQTINPVDFIGDVCDCFLFNSFVPEGLTEDKLAKYVSKPEYVAEWYVEHREDSSYE